MVDKNNFNEVKINEIMTKSLVTINETDTIEDVLELLKNYHFHTYPVVNDNHELVGVVNQDVLLEILLLDRIKGTKNTHRVAIKSMSENIKGIMGRHPLTLTTDSNLHHAADLMVKHKVNHLYVVENSKLVGVLSKRDIINHVYRIRGLY
ncbi:MAG: HPP family protein [Methanohalobium sp.]|uniref:CBS domain-containing protein n=1 Tax=Methanohalobium sp. TaxID=2837493 RepID=UPI003978920E